MEKLASHPFLLPSLGVSGAELVLEEENTGCGKILDRGGANDPFPTIFLHVSGMNKTKTMKRRPEKIAKNQNIHRQLTVYTRIPPRTGPTDWPTNAPTNELREETKRGLEFAAYRKMYIQYSYLFRPKLQCPQSPRLPMPLLLNYLHSGGNGGVKAQRNCFAARGQYWLL